MAKRNQIMGDLNTAWHPEWGTIYTWFGMDKGGRIAMLINNNFGNIPIALLSLEDIEDNLGHLGDYLYEESQLFPIYNVDKNSGWELDCYSYLMIGEKGYTRDSYIKQQENVYIKNKRYSDVNIARNKGVFIYQGIEGHNIGEDYPVGYDDGQTTIGDYYRYMLPTSIYGSIEDFPVSLRSYIAVSDTIDFTKDRLLDNNQINIYFPRAYKCCHVQTPNVGNES